jgi:DNA primase
MIPDDVITQIRDAADIVAVIGQHVQLRKAGRNWKGLCPFHGEKTPSFNVSADKGFYHCFGCAKHGDVFTFIMELEGKSFVEAAEQLANRFGIVVPRIEEPPEVRRARGERVTMLDINRIATAFYREMLVDPRGEPGRAYLAKRGVAAEVAEKFQLGYAPGEWSLLADHLKAKHVDMELAVRVGLVAHRPRSGGYYDRNRDRLVCPVIVPGGEIVGFSSRIVGAPKPAEDGSEPPKYINSPESTVYKKSKLLFGLAQAREAMQAQKRAVLVEGNFDVITLHQAGFAEVVAPLGTALTIEQVSVLKRLTEKIVLLYDGDRAGYKATMHALQMCVEADVEVLVARRPGHGKSGGAGMLADGVDPDSLVAGGGPEVLRESVDRAMGGIEFFAFEVWAKARGNADARARALEDAGRLLAKVANQVKRDLLLHTLATALGVDMAVVRSAVARAGSAGSANGRPGAWGGPTAPPGQGHGQNSAGQHPYAPGDHPASDAAGSVPETPPSGPPPPTDELEVIVLLADHPSLIATVEADKAFWLLTDTRLQAMYSAARAGQPFHELVAVHLPSPTAQLVLSGKYAEAKDPRASLVAMTRNLEVRKTQVGRNELNKSLADAGRTNNRELARKLAQLAQAERKGDHELAARIKESLASDETSSPGKQVD